MNVELTKDELEVITHALLRLNAHNSKMLDQEAFARYRKEHIDFLANQLMKKLNMNGR